MSTSPVIMEKHGRVAILRLHRPEALNALNSALMQELTALVDAVERDDDLSCLILTGSERAFAAGADIKEMASISYPDVVRSNLLGSWDCLARMRKPSIAAVAGFALGGGCELALMCDIIIASDDAKFGQPEIKLGVIPGIGGTQRLIRAVGKSKAMEMCLTGRTMDAVEAERTGLVARVVPKAELMNEALRIGQVIGSMSGPSVAACKEALNRAYEVTLAEGVLHERRLFHSLFALNDRTEGMRAFVEKRPANFTGT